MRFRDVDPQYLSLYPYYGRHAQDRFLHEHVFGDLRNGVFVDIGAYDGVESSNTLFFEESLGWNGICIEPLPNIFSKLVINRKCHCINKCALDRYTNGQFFHVIPDRKKDVAIQGRRSNIEKLSGLTEYSTKLHQQMIDKKIQEVGGAIEYFEVECVPINTLLSVVKTKIDLLSLDTEGSELQILQAIDFDQFNIDVIVVEDLFSDAALGHFMKAKKYTYVKTIGYDSIYIKK